MIRELLREIGPMGSRELMEFIPLEQRTIARLITGMRRAKRPEYRVRIARWVRDLEGAKHVWRAQYGLGTAGDARKPPKYTNAEACRRKRAKQNPGRYVSGPVSVWQLGSM